ncbi:MAG: quinolinate synthase NadA [Acidobacteriota bacterium]
MVTQLIPEQYMFLSDAQAIERITESRKQLGRELLVLGHHYQRDEVIQFADLRGDSFGLSRKASENKEARYIVFCGVHFMAESACILSAPHQKVILPDLEAGCSMADMADIDQVEEARDNIESVLGKEKIIPIAYINCTAAVKAFCGDLGGTVCTSSNASAVIDWGFKQREKIFFLPDEHLGRNMGYLKGIPLEQLVLWDPSEKMGGLTREQIQNARIILWKGYCQVHQRFAVEQIEYFRKKFPDMKIIVHPECSLDVVQRSDYAGSTSYIIDMVQKSGAGTKWAIGTEIHLVNRLRNENPDKLITSLVPGVCLCSTMNRIDPQHLLWVLDQLLLGNIVNEIRVPQDTARKARLALDRMLSIS